MEPAAEITHRRRHARADDMGADLSGDRGAIDRAAFGADARMGLMLGDDRGQLGEFGDLVPGGAQRRRDRVRWAKASGRDCLTLVRARELSVMDQSSSGKAL